MNHPTDHARWRDLEANAHLPEVQEIIRQEILNGTIRVRPKPGGGIRILPIGIPDSGELREMQPPPAPLQDGTSPSTPVVRLAGHRLARH
jgi:hypothetical protein